MKFLAKATKPAALALTISALFPLAQSTFAARTWLGGSSNWNTAANWSGNAVPGSSDNVIIPSGLSAYPVVSTSGAAVSQIYFSGSNSPMPTLTIANGGSLTEGGNLVMVPGATILIHAGGTLTLNANCNNAGMGLLDMDGGTLVFNGNNLLIPAVLTGGTVDVVHSDPHIGITNFYNLIYSGGSHAFTLTNNVTVAGNLDVAAGSVIAVNGYSVTANTLTLGSTTETAGAYNGGNASAYITGLTTYVTVSAGPAARLAFTTQPANTIAGQVLSNVVVQVQDASGNNVASGNVPITILLNTNALSGGNTATNSNLSGAAMFTGLLINTAGSYTMTAAASGLTSATSSAFAVSAVGSGNQVIAAPPLSISAAGGAVKVSWLAVSGWNLQQNSNLANSSGWSTCSGVVNANGTNSVTISSPTGSMFFRLYQ